MVLEMEEERLTGTNSKFNIGNSKQIQKNQKFKTLKVAPNAVK